MSEKPRIEGKPQNQIEESEERVKITEADLSRHRKEIESSREKLEKNRKELDNWLIGSGGIKDA